MGNFMVIYKTTIPSWLCLKRTFLPFFTPDTERLHVGGRSGYSNFWEMLWLFYKITLFLQNNHTELALLDKDIFAILNIEHISFFLQLQVEKYGSRSIILQKKTPRVDNQLLYDQK